MDLALDAFDLSPETVRRRFAWAVDRGQPLWLWPEVEVESWRRSLEAIEATARAVLMGLPADGTLDGEPLAFSVACYTSGMGPLLGFWVEQGRVTVTPAVAEILSLHLRHNRLRMERLQREAAELITALAAQGVAVTVFKGMHTAHAYFPDPGTRPVSDIDLLIAPADRERANEVLRGAGYNPGVFSRWPPQRNWRRPDSPTEPRSLCFVHADDPWSIDLQTSLDRRYSAGAPIIRLDGAIEPTSRTWERQPAAQVLRQPLLLLQLAIHASFNLISLNLLRLTEIHLVARRDTDEVFWNGFLEVAAKAGALGAAYPTFRFCEMMLPGTIPADVMDACERNAPGKVRSVLERLTPSSAHRVLRMSLAERFMWTGSWFAAAKQVAGECFPAGDRSPRGLIRSYRMRVQRLRHGTITR